MKFEESRVGNTNKDKLSISDVSKVGSVDLRIHERKSSLKKDFGFR